MTQGPISAALPGAAPLSIQSVGCVSLFVRRRLVSENAFMLGLETNCPDTGAITPVLTTLRRQCRDRPRRLSTHRDLLSTDPGGTAVAQFPRKAVHAEDFGPGGTRNA